MKSSAPPIARKPMHPKSRRAQSAASPTSTMQRKSVVRSLESCVPKQNSASQAPPTSVSPAKKPTRPASSATPRWLTQISCASGSASRRRHLAVRLPRTCPSTRRFPAIPNGPGEWSDVSSAETLRRDKRGRVSPRNSVAVGGDRSKELRRARYCRGRSRHQVGIEEVTAAIGQRRVRLG